MNPSCYAKQAKPAELLIQKPQNEVFVGAKADNDVLRPMLVKYGAATRMGRAFEGDPQRCAAYEWNNHSLRTAPCGSSLKSPARPRRIQSEVP